MAWLCLQKGNQAWCPKPVSGANRIWANMQFVHVRANTNTKIRAHTNKHTLTHKMHMMQTNKQTNRDPDFLCSSLFVNPTDRQKNLATHARVRNARLPTEHHHLSGVKIQVAYSSLSSFQLGNGRAHERNLNKRALSASLIQA